MSFWLSAKEDCAMVDPLSLPGRAGRLHIQNFSSFLNTQGGSFLLLIHSSPEGTPDSQSAGAATSFLTHSLGKTEGSPLTVWGYQGTLGALSTIAIVKAQ
jgi:hypothetical protein